MSDDVDCDCVITLTVRITGSKAVVQLREVENGPHGHTSASFPLTASNRAEAMQAAERLLRPALWSLPEASR